MLESIYDYDPDNLPPELLTAIGRAIAAGSQTEAIIAAAIMGCLGIDSEYGIAVTAHMTLPLKFNVLKAAAEIRIDNLDDLDILDTILEEIDNALAKRHAVAHDSWFRNSETNATFRSKITARGSVAAQLIPVTAEAVEKDAAFIKDAGMRLMTFIMEKGLLPPIPRPRPRAHKLKAARKKRRK